MSSRMMTFSLASLILIFALAFVAMPAIAATGGPTVTFAEYSGPEDPATAADATTNAPHEQARDDFRVLLTFSHSVAALEAADVEVRMGSADGTFAGSAAIAVAPVEVLDSGGKKYVATVTATGIADTITQVFVSIDDDAIDGNRNNLLGNVGNSMTFTLPPLNVGTVMLAAPKAVADTPGDYTIVATFDSKADPAATHTLSPNFSADYVDIMPENAATATVGTVDTSTDNKAVVTITVTLRHSQTARISIDPGYVAGSNTITLPPAVTAKQNPPTVTLEVVSHDASNRSFEISVSTTPVADTDGETGAAIAGDDIKAALKIKDSNTPAADVDVMLLDGDDSNESSRENSYRAVLEYGRFDTLPLTVSIDPNDLSNNADATDVDPVTAMVGDTDEPDPDNNAPVFASTTTTRSVAENTAAGMSIGDPVTATDADNDTLTYSLSGTDMASFAIVAASGQLQTKAALDYETKTSYMVTVTADDSNGGTDTIDVTINVTNDTTDDPADTVVTVTLSDVVKSRRVDSHWRGSYELNAEIGPSTGRIIIGSATSDSGYRYYRDEIDVDIERRSGNEYDIVLGIRGLSDYFYIEPMAGYDLQVSDDPRTMDTSDDAVSIARLYIRVDRLGPRITSIRSTVPAEGGPVTVNIHFDEPLSTNPTPAHFDVKNGAISNINLVTPGEYAATVTPNHGVGPNQSVEIRLKAGLMDEHGNASVATAATATADGSFSPRMATTDDTPAQTPTSAEGMLSGLSVPAEGFVVIVRDAGVQGLPNTVTGAMKVEWAGMPDLEDLLYRGGTIDLTRAKLPKLDHDNKSDTDTRDAGTRDLIITEVMWAKNTALTGKAGELDHQWIEIHNPLKTAVGGVTLKTTERRNFQTVADTDVLLDRLSNQVGNGWALEGLGQSGSDDMNDATNDTKVDFISMYRKERGKDGWVKGHWAASTETAITGHKATPGRLERKTGLVVDVTPVPRSPFVINEFGIGNSDGEDWIELRNVTDSQQTLKNLLLTVVTGLDNEAVVFHFHDKDLKVPANGVVLIASRDPIRTDIAAGVNLEIAPDEQDKTGVMSIYAVRSFDLPTGKFNLILRKDFNNKFDADFKGKALDKVIDAIGSLKVDKDTADFNTDFWPLNGTGAPHGDVIDGKGQDFKASTVYKRNNAAGGTGEHHLGEVGWTGVGYDRGASDDAENGGTPGFDNGAVKDKLAGLSAGSTVSISEIMLEMGSGRQNLPQWIELYNSSMTEAVELNGWKLTVENAAEPEVSAFNATITFKAMRILPNQTVLIVSNRGSVSEADHFPSSRVVNIWQTKAHRDAFEMQSRFDQIFSTNGLYIKLADKDGEEVDTIGNLDGNRRTRDEPTWKIPRSEDPDRRSSLIRIYSGKRLGPNSTRGTDMKGDPAVGTTKDAWMLASKVGFADVESDIYYGHPDDQGTPGFRTGGPLPVSLSKFRPERLKDTGEIVVRWITESELNNAGFNILRSDKRDGEFTKVHYVAGQGTTSERTVYEWKDTSAKPNVVYYYQIQDVSLDGEVTTLRTTHLRGNVTAAGKATTTWGEIKALQ